MRCQYLLFRMYHTMISEKEIQYRMSLQDEGWQGGSRDESMYF